MCKAFHVTNWTDTMTKYEYIEWYIIIALLKWYVGREVLLSWRIFIEFFFYKSISARKASAFGHHGAAVKSHMEPFEQHTTMIWRDLRGSINWCPKMPNGTFQKRKLLDGQWRKFRSVMSENRQHSLGEVFVPKPSLLN